jgi:hypothetical protein
MPTQARNIENISKNNSSILQTRFKFRDTSHNIHKKGI